MEFKTWPFYFSPYILQVATAQRALLCKKASDGRVSHKWHFQQPINFNWLVVWNSHNSG
jgi:hypothetical protein